MKSYEYSGDRRDDEMVKLTHKWCEDLKGKDVRDGIGACCNVLTTLGNYSPEDVRKAAAKILRTIANEFGSRRDQ